MAKKYRIKNDGKDIVTVVFAGWGKDGRWEYNGDEYLKGLTPQAHCAQKIQERGEGFFKEHSVKVKWQKITEQNLEYESSNQYSYEFKMPASGIVTLQTISECDTEHIKQIWFLQQKNLRSDSSKRFMMR